MSESQPTAIVVGVGSEQGTGAAVARRFARENYNVIVSGRTESKISQVARTIVDSGHRATSFVADAAIEADVVALFDDAERTKSRIEVVVFNAGNQARHDFRTMPAEFFESAWRSSALSGFLVGREAVRRMLPHAKGTVIFTGATASLRGRPPFTAFASAKSALRSLAQSMGREFGPLGVHVAHVIIDGGIDGEILSKGSPKRKTDSGENGLLHIDAIADVYWHLHRQHPSAWTHEMDLRPFKEPF